MFVVTTEQVFPQCLIILGIIVTTENLDVCGPLHYFLYAYQDFLINKPDSKCI